MLNPFRIRRSLFNALINGGRSMSEQEYYALEIAGDLKRLGIRGRVKFIQGTPIIVYFKSMEDMLAYKLLGNYKEGIISKYTVIEFRHGFWSWVLLRNYKRKS